MARRADSGAPVFAAGRQRIVVRRLAKDCARGSSWIEELESSVHVTDTLQQLTWSGRGQLWPPRSDDDRWLLPLCYRFDPYVHVSSGVLRSTVALSGPQALARLPAVVALRLLVLEAADTLAPLPLVGCSVASTRVQAHCTAHAPAAFQAVVGGCYGGHLHDFARARCSLVPFIYDSEQLALLNRENKLSGLGVPRLFSENEMRLARGSVAEVLRADGKAARVYAAALEALRAALSRRLSRASPTPVRFSASEVSDAWIHTASAFPLLSTLSNHLRRTLKIAMMRLVQAEASGNLYHLAISVSARCTSTEPEGVATPAHGRKRCRRRGRRSGSHSGSNVPGGADRCDANDGVIGGDTVGDLGSCAAGLSSGSSGVTVRDPHASRAAEHCFARDACSEVCFG